MRDPTAVVTAAEPASAGRTRFKRMRARDVGWAAVVLMLVALTAWGAPRLLLGASVPTATVVRRDLVQSVVASGRVEAPNRVTIGAQITGVVRRIPVAEGQRVQAGQVLLELEHSEAKAAADAAELAAVQAEARLRQLREVQAPVAEQTLRQAQVNLENARATLRRQTDLFAQGFIGQAALDEARRNVDLNEAQVRATQRQLETTQPQGSDFAMARAALQQARASAEAARSRLAYTTIAAPVAGTLIARSVEAGDIVQPGKALMVLSPSGAIQLVVQIDERNLQRLAVGQPARASADAYPERRFAATLAYINPGVDAQRGSVEVKLDVPTPPPYLRENMTVSVEIEVARRADAVLVPTDALHDAAGDRPWVLRVVEGRAHRQPVRAGLQGVGMTEVVEGLSPGDRVVAGASADIADGARVRVAPAASAASDGSRPASANAP